MNRWVTLGGAESLAVLVGKRQYGSCLVETAFKHLKCRRSLLRELPSEVVEPILRLLLRGSLENLIHPVFIGGRRLIHHVALEVRLTPLPDQAQKRLP